MSRSVAKLDLLRETSPSGPILVPADLIQVKQT
jgi:hypothetical protein